jgi:hypothetical protein
MSYFTITDPTTTEELDYTSLDISDTLLDDMVRENTTTSPTAEDEASGFELELQSTSIEPLAPKKELTEAEKAERKERRKVEKKERREKARERDLAAKAERGGVEMMKMRKAAPEGRTGAAELKDVIKRVAYLENFMKRVTSLEGEERSGSGRGKRERRGGRVEGRGRGGQRRGGRGRGGVNVGGDYQGEKASSGVTGGQDGGEAAAN